MTETLTIRMPSRLIRELKAKARAEKKTVNAVLLRLVTEYVQTSKQVRREELRNHIAAYAGTWDGYCSGEVLLRKTRR